MERVWLFVEVLGGCRPARVGFCDAGSMMIAEARLTLAAPAFTSRLSRNAMGIQMHSCAKMKRYVKECKGS